MKNKYKAKKMPTTKGRTIEENNKKIKNKIGYVDNKYLNIDKPNGHYVYIRKVNKDGTCDINLFTSLEHRDENTNELVFTKHKIEHLKKGNTYSIPKKDTNLPRWSGVTKKIRKVKTKNIELEDIILKKGTGL